MSPPRQAWMMPWTLSPFCERWTLFRAFFFLNAKNVYYSFDNFVNCLVFRSLLFMLCCFYMVNICIFESTYIISGAHNLMCCASWVDMHYPRFCPWWWCANCAAASCYKKLCFILGVHVWKTSGGGSAYCYFFLPGQGGDVEMVGNMGSPLMLWGSLLSGLLLAEVPVFVYVHVVAPHLAFNVIYPAPNMTCGLRNAATHARTSGFSFGSHLRDWWCTLHARGSDGYSHGQTG